MSSDYQNFFHFNTGHRGQAYGVFVHVRFSSNGSLLFKYVELGLAPSTNEIRKQRPIVLNFVNVTCGIMSNPLQ